MRNFEVTIFEVSKSGGTGIGGTCSVADIGEDLENDSMFGDEYKGLNEHEKMEWILDELMNQVKSELNRVTETKYFKDF